MVRKKLKSIIGIALFLIAQVVNGQTFISVGTSGQDFITIQDAYDAIPSPTDDQYIIEIDQSYDASNEVFPITFGVKGSSIEDIIIRPNASATDINVTGDPGNADGLVKIFDADYVTIDGRPGGLGFNRVLSFINVHAEGYAVFDINQDATNITLDYLNIQGEADANASGLINFRGNAGSTGGDDNTVSNCIISDILSGGSSSTPGVAIFSNGNLTRRNDRLSIINNQFIDIYDGSESSSFVIEINQATDDLVIEGNHFYQLNDYTLNNNSSGFIFYNNSENLTVNNNSFGGTNLAASGGRFKVVSGNAPYDVLYVASAIGHIDVTNNLVSNMEVGGQNNTTFSKMSVFYLDGNASMNISNNTIGDTSNVASILIAPAGGSSGHIFTGIYTGASSGNVDITGNAFGGLIFDGSLLNKDIILVETNNGDVHIDGNYFGGDQPNSIEIKPDDAFYGISNLSTGQIDITNNEFKYINQLGGGGSVNLILCWGGLLNMSDNNIRNIDMSGNKEHRILDFDLSTQDAIISGNRFEHINQSSTLVGANFIGFDISSDADITVTNNIVGSDGANDISLSAPSLNAMINKTGAGTFLCQGNEIRNVTGFGTNTVFCGILNQNTGIANISGNTISGFNNQSINAAGASVSAICALASGNGHQVIGNTIENIGSSSSSNVAIDVFGIVVESGNGSVLNNSLKDVFNNCSSTNGSSAYIQLSQSGTWEVENNVILQTSYPGPSSDNYGIEADGSAVGNVHHNTVYLQGTVSGSAHSSAFQDNSSGQVTIRNNVFANAMTGGIGNYAAFHNGGAGGPDMTNDYNYLVASDLNKIGFSTSQYSIIFWRTQTGGGTNSIVGNFSELDANGYPVTGFTGEDIGDPNVFTGGIVTVDKDGRPRDNTPWMGAYEGDAPVAIAGAEEPGSGNALSFNGTQSFATATVVSNAANDFTQEFWFKWDGTLPGHHQIITHNGIFGVDGFNVHLRNTNGEIYLNISGAGSFPTGYVPEADTWTHVAISYSAGNVWLVYVNGEQLVSSNLLNLTAPTGSTTFGESGGGGFNYYGEIDEFRYWSKERNINEIRQDMCSKIKSSEPDFSTLDWYFRFDEGSGATLTDHINESATNIVGNWAVSGAPIGDTSVFDYGSSSLGFGEEDQFSVENYSPGITGMHIYFVDDTVNNATAPTGIGNFDEQGYYGVFKVGGADDSYDAVYDYTGNPNVDGQSYEPDVRLITRANNASVNWKKATGPIATNTSENELRLAGQTGTEYVIGLANTTYPDEPGSGYAIEVTGGNRISIPDDPSLNFGGTDFTIEFWMYYTDNTTAQHIIDKNIGANEGYLIELNNSGQVVFTIEDNVGTTSTLSSSSLNTNQWIHVACVYKFGTGSTAIYINGRPDAGIGGTAGINAVSSNSLVIGADQGGATPFTGRIDEVRIWGSSVGINNVRGYMCSKSLKSHPNFATLRAYYRLDDNVNTTVQDLHGGNDGAVSVGVTWPFSGAPIGDTSVYNYSNASDLVLDAGNGSGEMTLIQDVDFATCDSLHLYYVNDTMRVAAQFGPVGADSLHIFGYFGTFVASTSTQNYGLYFDYNAVSNAASHPNEPGLRLVGRGDHSMNSWGYPNNAITTVDDLSNLIEVDTIDGSAEITIAYTSLVEQPYYVNDGMGGDEIYTTNSGNDIAGCGTPSNPCATLKYVVDSYDLFSGDTVYVDAGDYRDSNIVASADTAIVIGAGIGVTTYDGSPNSGSDDRFIHISTPGWVIAEMDIEDYDYDGGGDGGAILLTDVNGDFEMYDVRLDDNDADNGGNLYASNSGGDLTSIYLENVTISRGEADNKGGGLMFDAGGNMNVFLTQCEIGGTGGFGNRAMSDDGGGIYFDGDTLYIYNSQLVDNYSDKDGGGVYVNNGYLFLDTCYFAEDTALVNGGGVYSVGQEVSILNGTEIGDAGFINFAGNRGGGVYFTGDTLFVEESFIQSNESTSQGGGLYLSSVIGFVFESEIVSNVAGSTGGGIYLGGAEIEMEDSYIGFNTNAVANGGGVNMASSAILRCYSCEFEGNVSAANGGAIANGGDSLFIQNSLFHDNTPGSSGVIMTIGSSKTTFLHSTMANNDGVGLATPGSGSGVVVDVRNSIVYSNTGNAILENDGVVNVEFSVVENGTWTGLDVGNTNVNPSFAALGLGDFTLLNSSSAIDLGSALYGVSDDLNDSIRPVGGGYDAGAFESSYDCDSSNIIGTWNWTGANSTDWFDCGNWDMGSIPGVNAAVLVPGTGIAPNQPLIENDPAFCKTISIDSDNGGNVTLDSDSGASLEITNP